MIKMLSTDRLSKILLWAAGLLAFLSLLYSMDILSRNIGFYWDEVWDYVPSVALINGDSFSGNAEVRLRHRPLPLVSGPYQGALKTWTVAPLINLIGTSPHKILTLNVIFGMIYLAALYWAVSAVIGKWAWAVFLIPFLDSNFLLIAPMDYGPSLFQFIFISLAMGAMFRFMNKSELKYYRLTWFFTGCTLAQKLTAIPIVISLIAVAIVLMCGPFWKSAGKGQWFEAAKSYVIIPGLVFLIPMVPHLLYFLRAGFSDLFSMTADGVGRPYFPALYSNIKDFHTVFDGAEWCRRITSDASKPAAEPPVLLIFGLVVMAISGIIFFASGREKRHGRHAIVGTAVILCSFLAYPLFRGLNRPWHFWVLTPLFACCVILSSANCLSCLVNRHRKSAIYFQSLFALCLVSGVALSAANGFEVLRQIENRKGVCLTSPAITEAYKALRAANTKKVYGVNYSIAYPIYVLSKGRIRADELGFTDLNSEKIDELLNNVREDPDSAIVYRICDCKEADPTWIRWLNRDPQIFNLIRSIENQRSTLEVQTIRDQRNTEFVLVRKSQTASLRP